MCVEVAGVRSWSSACCVASDCSLLASVCSRAFASLVLRRQSSSLESNTSAASPFFSSRATASAWSRWKRAVISSRSRIFATSLSISSSRSCKLASLAVSFFSHFINSSLPLPFELVVVWSRWAEDDVGGLRRRGLALAGPLAQKIQFSPEGFFGLSKRHNLALQRDVLFLRLSQPQVDRLDLGCDVGQVGLLLSLGCSTR